MPSAESVASGGAGGVMSGAVTVATGETLPAASVWVTDRVSPLACGVVSGALKLPSAATVTVASTLLSGARTIRVAPGSPVPLMLVPSAPTVPTGAVGATRSGVTATLAGEVLPAASVWMADSVWPLATPVGRATPKLPSLPTVAVPIGWPPASTTCTVAPGSPVPVSCVPSALTVTIGAVGAVISGALMVVAGEVLPAGSLCVTVRVSPLACGVVSGSV